MDEGLLRVVHAQLREALMDRRSAVLKDAIEDTSQIVIDSHRERIGDPAWAGLSFPVRLPLWGGWVRTDLEHEKRQDIQEGYEFINDLESARHPKTRQKIIRENARRFKGILGTTDFQFEELKYAFVLREEGYAVGEKLVDLSFMERRTRQFFEIAESEGGIWVPIHKMWASHGLHPIRYQAALYLHNLVEDVIEKDQALAEIVKSRENNEFFFSRYAHRSFEGYDPIGWADPADEEEYRSSDGELNRGIPIPRFLGSERLSAITRDFVVASEGELEFDRAYEYFFPTKKGRATVLTGPLWVPAEMKTVFHEELNRHVNQKTEGAREKIDSLTTELLEKWSEQGPDFWRIFNRSKGSWEDRGLVKRTVSLASGELVETDDPRVRLGLPGAIRAVIDAGYLDEDDVYPFLPPSTDPDYTIFTLPAGAQQKALQTLTRVETESSLPPGASVPEAGSGRALTRFGQAAASLLPERLQPDAKVLYSGKTLTVISGEEPGRGTLQHGHTNLVQLSPSDPSHPEAILLDGQYVRPRRFSTKDLRDYIGRLSKDPLIDFVASPAITIIPDISKEEFRREYASDFVASIIPFIQHADNIGIEEFMRSFTAEESESIELRMGALGRVKFQTIPLEERMGIFIDATRGYVRDTNAAVATVLVDFLMQRGIPFHVDQNINAKLRRELQEKKESAVYIENNLDTIVNALQGDGIIHVLAHPYFSDDWIHERLGVYPRDCERCGSAIYGGEIRRAKERNWISIWGHQLHELREHPDTLETYPGLIERIGEYIVDVKPHPELALQQFPQLSGSFRKWHDAQMRQTLFGRGLQRWMESNWEGLRAEEAEIEEDKALQMIDRMYNAGERRRDKLKQESVDLLNALHGDFIALGGVLDVSRWDDEQSNIAGFWMREARILDLYRFFSPTALPSPTVILESPVYAGDSRALF